MKKKSKKEILFSIVAILTGLVSLILSLSSPSLNNFLIIINIAIAFIAILFSYLSLKKIKLSNGSLSGKWRSLLSLIFVSLSLILLFFGALLPKIKYVINYYSNPPNYEAIIKIQPIIPQENVQLYLEQSKELISNRIKSMEVPYNIKTVSPDTIILQFTTMDTSLASKEPYVIENNFLSFHLVHNDNDSLIIHYNEPDFITPKGYIILPFFDKEMFYIVSKLPAMIGMINNNFVRIDSKSSKPYIEMNLNQESSLQFEQITQRNIGNRLAMVVDKKICSAPIITCTIPDGRIAISGNFTKHEVDNLKLILDSCGLPVKMHFLRGHFIKESNN